MMFRNLINFCFASIFLRLTLISKSKFLSFIAKNGTICSCFLLPYFVIHTFFHLKFVKNFMEFFLKCSGLNVKFEFLILN